MFFFFFYTEPSEKAVVETSVHHRLSPANFNQMQHGKENFHSIKFLFIFMNQ